MTIDIKSLALLCVDKPFGSCVDIFLAGFDFKIALLITLGGFSSRDLDSTWVTLLALILLREGGLEDTKGCPCL